jgi:hypothetical protein
MAARHYSALAALVAAADDPGDASHALALPGCIRARLTRRGDVVVDRVQDVISTRR